MAGTGRIISDSNGVLTHGAGSVLQSASPSYCPAPIPAPSRSMDSGSFRCNDNGFNILPFMVKSISSKPIERVDGSPCGYARTCSKAEEVEKIFSYLFGSDPYKMDGNPLAFITREVEVIFQSPLTGCDEKREFVIHNDDFVKDKATGLLYDLRIDAQSLPEAKWSIPSYKSINKQDGTVPIFSLDRVGGQVKFEQIKAIHAEWYKPCSHSPQRKNLRKDQFQSFLSVLFVSDPFFLGGVPDNRIASLVDAEIEISFYVSSLKITEKRRFVVYGWDLLEDMSTRYFYRIRSGLLEMLEAI